MGRWVGGWVGPAYQGGWRRTGQVVDTSTQAVALLEDEANPRVVGNGLDGRTVDCWRERWVGWVGWVFDRGGERGGVGGWVSGWVGLRGLASIISHMRSWARGGQSMWNAF